MNKTFVSVSLLLILASIPASVPEISLIVQASETSHIWVVLAACNETPSSASNDTQYMYHVLTAPEHFGLNEEYIEYLDVRNLPGVTDCPVDKEMFRWAITSWLESTPNDLIFIFVVGHGGGYHSERGMEGGRFEMNPSDDDEGKEVLESEFAVSFYPLDELVDWDGDGDIDDRLKDFNEDQFIEVDLDDDDEFDVICEHTSDIDGDGEDDDIFLDCYPQDNFVDLVIDADTNGDRIVDNWISDYEDGPENDGKIVGIDLNQNGNLDEWVGIDECIIFDEGEDPKYWDDELKDDLSNLEYSKLIFVRVGCAEEGSEGCFNGGLIDDISAPNRIIMTASDETSYAWADLDEDGFSEWSEVFIDALHGQNTRYDPEENEIIDEEESVNADTNNDEKVSMWEAFEYAWFNDDARIEGLETPWIDDNGNRLPTYSEGEDQLDGYPKHGQDGLFAYETYLGFEEIRSPDCTDECDQRVRVDDVLAVALEFGKNKGDEGWNEKRDLTYDDKIRIADVLIVASMFGKSYSTNSDPPSQSPVVSVYPTEITIGKQQFFTVNVTVTNVTDLGAHEFELYYNSTALNCTGLALPSGHFLEPVIDPNNIFTARLLYDNEYNSTHGFVWVSLSLMGDDEPFKNGSGTLATMNFTATAIGDYDLRFQETMLVNSSCQAMPRDIVDGSVTVLPSLTVLAQDQNQTALTTGDVYIDGEWRGFTGSTFLVNASTHEVFVNAFWEANNTGYRYGFMNWTDGSAANPRNITVLDDTTITANFYKKWCPGDVNFSNHTDISDILYVVYVYGSNRGDDDWDSRADVIYDGTITMDDIDEVVANYGNYY